MKPIMTMLVMLAPALASASGQAADTAKDRYNIDMTCSATVSSAIEKRALPTNMTPDEATSLSTIYATRAEASGHDAGISPAKIAYDTGKLRRTIVARLNSSDAAKAASEREGTARMTTNCAALLGFSLMGQPTAQQ